MEGPATYNLIMQRVHFDKTPISLDGDDENTTIVNSDFSLPFSTDIPATRKFENDSIIEVRDLHFYKKADFTQNALKNRICFFECDFKGSFAIQPLYLNPIFEECIFYDGFKITQWWNNNDDAINPEFKEQKKNRLHKDLIFNSCVLNGNFDLSNVSFDSTSTLVIENTYLPDTLDLTNLQVTKPINLLKSFPNINGKKCEIIITDFDVDKLLMQYRFFHLFIPPQILNNEKYHDYIASFYQRLLNRFKENGFIESYESLDIEFNRWKGKYDWTLVLSDYWWEFGYKKWRILLYTIGFIFIFSLFNYRKFPKLQEVYPVEKLKWNNFSYTRYTLLSFARKFFATLLYTGLIFFRFSIDYKNVTFKPMRYVVIIIFQYTVGLICTGFLINWILKG